MLTEDQIRTALRDCYDPTLALNIVDLGLVEHITLTPDPEAPGLQPRYQATLVLITTTHDEATEAQLAAQVANRLAAFYELFRTHVTFARTPTWTPARISPAGRRTLGLDPQTAQPQFPILNNRLQPG